MGTPRSNVVDGRLPTDRARGVVAAVDVLVISGLLVVGVVSHGGDPLSEPLETLETIVPFVGAWIPVAVAAGAYDRGVVGAARRSLAVTALAWIAAANVGLILRSSPAFDGGAEWPFNLIITGLGLAALLAWRGGYAAFLAD